MELPSKLKPIHLVLLLAILGIWGAVALQMVDAISGGDPETEVTAPSIRKAAIDSAGFAFAKVLRNPFQWGPERLTDSQHKQPKQILQTIPSGPPAMKLIGIVVGTKGRTALVELSDGSTSFLAENDTLAGVKILKILQKQVSYSFMKSTGTWTLD